MKRGYHKIPDASREAVLARSKGLCEIRLPGCWKKATEIHHKKKPKFGGSDDPLNLLHSCSSCHRATTDRKPGTESFRSWSWQAEGQVESDAPWWKECSDANSEYRWERDKWPDLEFAVDFHMAERWIKLLQYRFNAYPIALEYFTDGDGKLIGATGPFEFGARIRIYRPHWLRTLGHEFTHAMRWNVHKKTRHGDTWREDLELVQDYIRSKVPEMHWQLLPSCYWPRIDGSSTVRFEMPEPIYPNTLRK